MGLMTAIEDVVARFRAGEAEVARAFFSQPRPLEQHAFMLRIQVAREVRNLIEISRGELTAQVDRVDRGMTRDEIVAELREHYYETRHYAMLGNLLEGVRGSSRGSGAPSPRCTRRPPLSTAAAAAPSPTA